MHTLPNLPYAYDALEPFIDAETMKIHHLKHHQAYVDKLNTALEKSPELQSKKIEDLLKNLDDLPEGIQAAVRNHGGGHWNHTFFWTILAPANSPAVEMNREVKVALGKNFSSIEEFQKQFKEAGLNRFGSGWVWLIKNNNNLKIVSTANQETPLVAGQPILGLDVWEHAYYLKYQNRRADYLEAIFQIINWAEVGRLLAKAS